MKIHELIQELEKMPAGAEVLIKVEALNGYLLSNDFIICRTQDSMTIEINVSIDDRLEGIDLKDEANKGTPKLWKKKKK